MPMQTVHCSICGKAIKGYDFKERMDKLRHHRKLKHPSAHRQSIKKGLRTKGKLDPKLRTRKALIANPPVTRHTDYDALGTVRILHRENALSFPELALTVEKKGGKSELKNALENAGFTDEKSGKWVLRTNKFNIFVYI